MIIKQEDLSSKLLIEYNFLIEIEVTILTDGVFDIL